MQNRRMKQMDGGRWEPGFLVLNGEVAGEQEKAGTTLWLRVRGIALGSCLPSDTCVQGATHGGVHGLVRGYTGSVHTCTHIHRLALSADGAWKQPPPRSSKHTCSPDVGF